MYTLSFDSTQYKVFTIFYRRKLHVSFVDHTLSIGDDVRSRSAVGEIEVISFWWFHRPTKKSYCPRSSLRNSYVTDAFSETNVLFCSQQTLSPRSKIRYQHSHYLNVRLCCTERLSRSNEASRKPCRYAQYLLEE